MKRMNGSTSSRTSPALAYLTDIARRIEKIRADLPRLSALGEAMAAPLLRGGEIFTPRVAAYWPSEFGGRAGGLMGVRGGDYAPTSKNDVGYFAVPRRWDDRALQALDRATRSKAQLFVIGRPEDLPKRIKPSRFAGFTGGASPDQGLYGTGDHRPLVSPWPFEQFVRGWIAAGEMIAACTRRGRMPILWMSVWLEGALARNASFMRHHNLSEPWFAPLFHERWHVPPLPGMYMGREFLAALTQIHETLIRQSKQLAAAGAWMADAKRTSRRIWTVCVGHSYPEILELLPNCGYPLEIGPSFSSLERALPKDLKRGDVVLHLGYAPVNITHVRQILSRGLRFIHSSPYGRPDDLPDHDNFIWLDLPWRPADATVDLPGYSVRAMPMSSSAQTMALFAILAEMATRMGWE